MRPRQHGHDLDLGFAIGTGGLQLLLTTGLIIVVAAALLGPVLPPATRGERPAVTAWAAAIAVLLMLGGPLAAPDQVVICLLAAAAMPFFVARRPALPWTRPVRRIGPWVVLAALVGTGVELLAAVLGTGNGSASVRTGLLAGVVGLAWLTLCRPRSRGGARGLQVLAWVLGNAVLAGGTTVLVAGIPT